MNKIYLVEAKHPHGFQFIVAAYFQKKNAERTLKLIEEARNNPDEISEEIKKLTITSCDLKFMNFRVDEWETQDFPEELK